LTLSSAAGGQLVLIFPLRLAPRLWNISFKAKTPQRFSEEKATCLESVINRTPAGRECDQRPETRKWSPPVQWELLFGVSYEENTKYCLIRSLIAHIVSVFSALLYLPWDGNHLPTPGQFFLFSTFLCQEKKDWVYIYVVPSLIIFLRIIYANQ
jgi:hypothetical protein